MGTAHGAEELDLCAHGFACQAGAWAAAKGFAYDMAIFGQKSKVIRPEKILWEAHNFFP
jgi:hypothetical protein